MITGVQFNRKNLAPCGINCGTCRAYLRSKNNCPGCMADSGPQRTSCLNCKIRNCAELRNSESEFCYDCSEFPCSRLKHIDKRYKTKYRTSLIQNLIEIKTKGTEAYLLNERSRWTCKSCGSALCIHERNCIKCGKEYHTN
jgi:hypothetical protein